MNTFEDFLADVKTFGLVGLCMLAIGLLMLICFGGSTLVSALFGD